MTGVKIDPLVVTLPDGLTPSQNKFFRHLLKIIYDLRERTGGASDEVISNTVRSQMFNDELETDSGLLGLGGQLGIDIALDAFVSSLLAQLQEIDPPLLTLVQPQAEPESNLLSFAAAAQQESTKPMTIEVTGTTHTTAGNELLICTNTSLLTVTLNTTPDHLETVQVVRQGSGGVKVAAAALIAGKTQKTILRRYSAPKHIFTAEAASWSVI